MNNRKISEIHNDVFVGSSTFLAGAVLFCFSLKMPSVPRRFSLIVTGMFCIMSVALIITGIMEMRKPGYMKEKLYSLQQTKYSYCIFVMTLLYVIMLKLISFFPATIIYIPILMLFMRVKSWIAILLTTIGINVFVWLLFVVQLKVSLP